jgi:radical SAM protein (TIGR01212 family)
MVGNMTEKGNVNGVVPYRSFSIHLRERFGTRVYRVPIDGGFSCPNRDPQRPGQGGCIYCSERGSGSGMIDRSVSIAEQVVRGKEAMRNRYGAEKFLAYFQAYTNTLASPEVLRQRYDEALAVTDVVGLMVGTRPDALPVEVLDLLSDYDRRTYLWLELGIQSINDRQLAWMNRGHDSRATREALQEAAVRRLRVCGHLIFGLPGETRDDVHRTADFVNASGMAGVKIHLLHVIRGTELERLHRADGIALLERQEYVERVADFLERLSPEVVVHRLTCDGGRGLVAPAWARHKSEVQAAIVAEMVRRGSRQGYRAP